MYKKAWPEVKMAVDSADPAGLLGAGAPADEYDDAVSHLVGEILRNAEITAPDLSEWFHRVYGVEIEAQLAATLVDQAIEIRRALNPASRA